jgi:hypothetical protein
MDDLTIAMCLCIGNAVAWLLALYTQRGLPRLLWDIPLGTAGATLCALTIAWLALKSGGVWLLIAGPLSALVAILAGHAIRRAVRANPA